MEGEGGHLPFGYTHRQKRSHAQIQEEDGSASSAWTFNPYSVNDGEGYDDYQPGLRYHQRQTPNFHLPPPRYQDLDQRRTPEPPLQPHPNPFAYEPLEPPAVPQTDRPSSVSAPHPPTAGLHLPQVDDMASDAPRRFAGDGFDYRRPAGSAREQDGGSVDLTGGDGDVAIDLSRDDDIIDLTADDSGYGPSQDGGEQHQNRHQHPQPDRGRRANNGVPRLPRGMDIIIDLDNGDEEWRPAPEPSSPDIEFISSRTIHNAREPNNADADEVQFVRENALPEAEARRRSQRELSSIHNMLDLFGTINGRVTHLRAQVNRFNATMDRTARRFHEPIVPARSHSRGHAVRTFIAPVMDFDMVGFNIGPHVREPEPAAPTYKAPEKAPEGFTRSPEEDGGALVCPNCDEELCVGDDDVKRQVWVAKACGHVYCGECTANRSVKRSSKGKERHPNTAPFKACVVEECGKNVSHKKSMIQVFL